VLNIVKMIFLQELQKNETTIEEVKEAKGGRVNLRGGGCAKRGIKKNAYGRNS
jgi:hypothetical protein